MHEGGAPLGTSSGRRSYRDALRHPVAGRVWAAAAISVLGDYVGQGALLLLAFERSGGRAIGAATLFAVGALPALLSGALAGSWLDQIPRGRALASLHGIGAAVIAVPLAADGLAPVFVAAGLLGALRAATISVRSGALAEGVPDDHRGPVLALIGTTEQVGQVIGYLAGATLTVTIGAQPALLVDLATFVLGAILVARIAFPPPVPRDRRPPITAGLREILGHPVLRLLLPLVWITASVAAIPEVLATEATASAPGWTPIVMAAGPAGQALTMLVVGRLPHLERPSVQLTHFVTLALALGLGALSDAPAWLALANVLVGGGAAWLLGPQLTFMREARPERMAQVTGTMVALLIVAEGVGSPVFAAIADQVSVRGAYRAAGAVVLLAALVGWFVKERTPRARALDDLDVILPSWTDGDGTTEP